jgi:hypothetical protein
LRSKWAVGPVAAGRKHVIYGTDTKPDPNTYWVVTGKLLAGEYPGDRDPEEAGSRLRRFLAAGVCHFIDLTEAGELTPYDLLTEEAGSRTT